MANIIGSDGNDTLLGTNSDTINGQLGNDTLTGGGSKDTFVYNLGDGKDTITDFGGVGKGTNPTAAVIAEVDTIKFIGEGLTARNLLLAQNGTNLEISFERINGTKLILQNFKLEDLENLKASVTRPAIGNILFDGQTSITDSFDVFNANSTETSIGIKNTVTFLNDLDNNITGLDSSDDVINGQGGNDKIDGLSGNDLLRGGAGNNTLNGGADSDYLNVKYSTGNNLLNGDDGNDSLFASGDYDGYTVYIPGSTGKNTLNGGNGNDYLNVDYSTGNNLLSGGNGDDTLSASDYNNGDYSYGPGYIPYTGVSGNNTLIGGAGNDYLNADYSAGNNLLDGGDGNDILSADGPNDDYGKDSNNTLNGGNGDDTLDVYNSRGDNLLNGGDGNDTLIASGFSYRGYEPASGDNTLNGGAGNDYFDIKDSTGNNLLSGGDGNDSFYVQTSYKTPSYLATQTIDGGKGDDLLSGDYGSFTRRITSNFNATTKVGSITAGTYHFSYKNIERLNIQGTGYNDSIVGSNGNDTLNPGGGGKDTIDGGQGDDILLFVDYVSPSKGITTTFNATNNSGSIKAGTQSVSYKNIERLNIRGTDYNDFIAGNNGNDTLNPGDRGKDTIDGGQGDDILSVGYLYASESITTTFNATNNSGSIKAGTESVSYKNIERLNIRGTQYNDSIVGNNGNDTLTGQGGNDTLIGGAGIDTFSFNGFNEGSDRIFDFNPTNEAIQVSASGFGGGLSLGVLKASQFTIGTSATTSSQRFIYNSTTGALFFDSDGSAGGFAKVQFALLTAGLSLTSSNFVVV
ncbi:MAG: calcium-binding protein [Nostoc sp. ChiSLP02]|nr:calcium-binding protein [Nostoc sp. ChiSLP02]